ncbi:hypothetical protein HMPREF1864_01568 [Peptoniphilus sp. DNF00840]|nr:hypothetical protein HMPREF1864_01568 [Peptoniphilus sp. DNF00840]
MRTYDLIKAYELVVIYKLAITYDLIKTCELTIFYKLVRP